MSNLLFGEPTSPVEFLIMTALEEEREAILDQLPGYRLLLPTPDDPRIYYTAQVIRPTPTDPLDHYEYTVIVFQMPRMGQVEAASATKDAIRRWRPRYVLLVGIAGGVAANRVRLGDVLIADEIVDYTEVKDTSQGMQYRPHGDQANPRLLQAAQHLIDSAWLPLIKHPHPAAGIPDRQFGLVLTGNKVIASQTALDSYRAVYPKMLGVEMEAWGVARAVAQTEPPPGFLMIRGVSDLADEQKSRPELQEWRSYARQVAAAFAIGLISSGLIPPLADPPPSGPGLAALRTLARPTNQIWLRGGKRGLGALGAKQRYRLGDQIYLALDLMMAGHLLLLDEGPEGIVYCLCPSHYAPNTRLQSVLTYFPQLDTGYDYFEITGTFGREYLVAVITDEPLGFDWMPPDATVPARVLHQADIDRLLTRLRGLKRDQWTALYTYYDIVS